MQTLRLTPPSFEGSGCCRGRSAAPGIETADALSRRVSATSAHLVCITGDRTRDRDPRRGRRRDAKIVPAWCAGLTEVVPRASFCARRTRPRPTTRSASSAPGSQTAARSIDGLHALMHAVRDDVEYEIGRHGRAYQRRRSARRAGAASARITPTSSSPPRARPRRSGALRQRLFPVPAAMTPSEAHHAWAEALVEGLGWVGFDPANRMCPTDRYVRLACGLDAASAAPIRGNRRGGANEALDVVVEVQQQTASNEIAAHRRREMTYGVAMRLDRGLVFAADTRTNAGVDNIAQYRKLHFWRQPGDRVLVLLSAGNLAVTQSVVSPAQRAADGATSRTSTHLFNAAEHVPGGARRRRRDARGAPHRRRRARSDQDRLFRVRSSSAARSAPSGRACSRSTRKATSSRRPTTRRSFRSASTSTASRSSTAWRRPTCGSAKRQS